MVGETGSALQSQISLPVPWVPLIARTADVVSLSELFTVKETQPTCVHAEFSMNCQI